MSGSASTRRYRVRKSPMPGMGYIFGVISQILSPPTLYAIANAVDII